MAGAGCIAGEEFGGRGIIVSDWGGGCHIKIIWHRNRRWWCWRFDRGGWMEEGWD